MRKFIADNKKIVISYFIFSLVWLLIFEVLLFDFIQGLDSLIILQLSNIFKYLSFALLSGFSLYFLSCRCYEHLKKENNQVELLNKKLEVKNLELRELNQELDNSLVEFNRVNKRFVSMIEILSSLNNEQFLNEEEFFSDLLREAIRIVPEADYGKIYTMENGGIKFIDAVGHDIKILKKIDFKRENIFDESDFGIFSSHDYSIKIKSFPREEQQKIKKALKPIKDSLYINISLNEKVIGRITLDIAAESSREFSQSTKKILESFATLASTFFAFKRYDKLQSKFTKEIISSIIRILEVYDNYTKGHSENVARISANIAEKMGLSRKMVMDAYWSGMVHDLGKLLVPINILNKKERLTAEEYEIIKKHPVWGSRSLANSSLNYMGNYILHHHERWDGSGYPAKLAGKEIPLISQILAVADSWDAMCSKRSYRKALSKEQAKAEIKKNRGTQFSPEVVDIFLEIVEEVNIYEQVIAEEEFEIYDFNDRYFEKLFEQSSEGIVILDSDFRIIKANNHFLKIFDYQRQEVINQSIKKIVVPEEKYDETEEFMRKMTEDQKINQRSYRKTKKGERIEVLIEAYSIKLNNGNQGYYVIYRDINILKSIENKYLNLQNKYRSVFENEDTVMLIIEPETGKIVDANPAAEKFYGWQKKVLLQKSITEINILSTEEIKREMQRAKNKNRKRFVFKHLLADNQIKEVEVYSQPIFFEDKEHLFSIIHEKI